MCGLTGGGQSLAITEPWVGSDVASLRTTAKLSSDKSHYVVNGEKKVRASRTLQPQPEH